MAIEATQANLDLIFRSANLNFQEVINNTPTFYSRLASTLTVGGSSVTYAWMDRLPVMRKWLGNRQINAVSTLQKTVTHDLWEHTFALRKVDLDDDNLGIFSMGVRQQAAQVAKWPDLLLAALFGTLGTVNGYDGVPVFSASHPLLNGATGVPSGVVQSNLLTSAALSYANYELAKTTMQTWNGADGQPLGINGNLLVVPPQLEGTARLILQADFLPSAPGVAGNASQTNIWKGTAELLVVPQLSYKPNNWYLFDTSQVIMPFIWQLREAPTFTFMTNPTDANVFLANQFLYGVAARAAMTESVWFLGIAGTSAGAY